MRKLEPEACKELGSPLLLSGLCSCLGSLRLGYRTQKPAAPPAPGLAPGLLSPPGAWVLSP